MSKKFEKAQLVVSPLTGEVYIAETSAKDPHIMTDSRRKLEKGEFMKAIVDYLEVKHPDSECVITANGKPVAVLKLCKNYDLEILKQQQ